MTNVLPSGRAQYTWRLGEGRQKQLRGVCRQCFMDCYQIGETFLLGLCNDIKGGVRTHSTPPLSDRTKPDSLLVKGDTLLHKSLSIYLSGLNFIKALKMTCSSISMLGNCSWILGYRYLDNHATYDCA